MRITKTLIVACLICSLFQVGCAKESSQNSAPSQVDSGVQRTVHAASPTASVDSEPGKKRSEYVPGSEILADQYSNLLALSGDEAAWLDRHGYPTQAEMDALLTYDVDELSSAMRNRKDPKSAALLGHRKLVEGDIGGAKSAFSAGANLGSLYAMQQLALVSALRVTGLPIDKLEQADQGNLGVMVARMEVARMLGDHRAQALIDEYTTNFDWDDYGKHVMTQTAIFMDQYGEYARARGERIMGPDPRPNAAAWDQLKKDPDSLVEVYTRSHPDP